MVDFAESRRETLVCALLVLGGIKSSYDVSFWHLTPTWKLTDKAIISKKNHLIWSLYGRSSMRGHLQLAIPCDFSDSPDILSRASVRYALLVRHSRDIDEHFSWRMRRPVPHQWLLISVLLRVSWELLIQRILHDFPVWLKLTVIETKSPRHGCDQVKESKKDDVSFYCQFAEWIPNSEGISCILQSPCAILTILRMRLSNMMFHVVQ